MGVIKDMQPGEFYVLASPENIFPYFSYLVVWKAYRVENGISPGYNMFPIIQPPTNSDQLIVDQCCFGTTEILQRSKKIVVH